MVAAGSDEGDAVVGRRVRPVGVLDRAGWDQCAIARILAVKRLCERTGVTGYQRPLT